MLKKPVLESNLIPEMVFAQERILCSGEDAFFPPIWTRFSFGLNALCFLLSLLVLFCATRGFSLVFSRKNNL